MGKYKGYHGKYIRVDLTKEEVKVLDLPDDLIENYLGGNGFGTKILWDEVPPEVEPQDPENRLIFVTGALTGTLWPSCGHLEVISKSPLTGIYGDANAGGFFAPELRFAGYDMIVFQGKAEEPVYLWIKDDKIELRDAKHLWGKDTPTTQRIIREELKDEKIKVASIGPAGENLVRFACIVVTENRACARSGMGAVMGSKNLKAIAVRGTKEVSLDNPEEFKKAASLARKAIREDEFTPGEHKYGTAGLVNIVNEVGRFPTRNLKAGHFEEADKISGEALDEKYFVRHRACYRCPIACDKVMEVREGEYKGTVTSSLEYETLCSLGAKCGNSNLASIIKMNVICDGMGMDTISAGGAISWAMECYEKGVLTKEDTDGLDLSWGNYHSMITLLEKIAQREGFGDLLAEGCKRAAEKTGRGSEKYAMHIKGMEIPAQDGRSQQSMGLAQVTSSRGADHLKGFPTIDETGYPGAAIKRYGEDKMPEIIDGIQTKHKPFVVKDGEEFCAVIDSSGICKFGTLFPPAVYWDLLTPGIKYALGLDIDVPKLKKIGERIYNLQRCYNILLGMSKKDDTQPERLLKEPSPSKRAKGHVVYLDRMLPEYYNLREWDEETGYPTRRKLEELGLGFAADKLKLK